MAFTVFGKSAAAVEPADGALNQPAFDQHDEALGLVRTFDDFHLDVRQGPLHARPKLRPLITAVGEEFLEERKLAKQRRHHQNAAVAVLHSSAVHEGVHQEALRIDKDVALLARIPAFAGTSLFACIITMRIDKGPAFSALFTL